MTELWELIQLIIQNHPEFTVPVIIAVLLWAGATVFLTMRGGSFKTVLALLMTVIEQFVDPETAKKVKQAVHQESKKLPVKDKAVLEKMVVETEKKAGK